jgi:hypothetical protein
MEVSPSTGSTTAGVMTVLDLVHGDHALEHRILQRFREDMDDSPLLFEWVDANLEAFWIKAVGYGGVVNSVAPPAEINKGAHLEGEATDANKLLFKQWILSFLVANGFGTVIDGQGVIGIYCTCFQSLNIGGFMARMEIDDSWFRGVMEHGPLLQGPLATLFVPLPPGDGLCAAITARSRLWP